MSNIPTDVATFGCWRAPSHGVGMQIHLRLVDGSHLAGYIVEADGSDGCRVCFAASIFGTTEMRNNSGAKNRKKRTIPRRGK